MQSADSAALSRNPQKARQSVDWLRFLGLPAVLELLCFDLQSTAFE